MAISKEFVNAVRERLAEDPGLPAALLARELDAPESQVVTAFPVKMRLRADNSDFVAIWQGMAGWRNLTANFSSPPSASEVVLSDGLPAGELQDGVFKLKSDAIPLAAIPLSDLGFIWFVDKPLRGDDCRAVRFFDAQGAHLLSIRLDPHDHAAQAAYETLRDRFGKIPTPPKAHGCRNCGKCTCGKKRAA